MWTFQEVILAQHPHILCGTKSLDWDDFLRGMDYIHRAESRTSEYTNVTVNLRSFAGSQVAAPQKMREKRFDREINQLRLMKDHMPARFDRWYAVLQLWMSIDRETMWRQRRMRNKTLGRTSMNAQQGPFSSTCPGWLQGRNLFLIESSYFFLGYMLLVTPYLGSYARAYWEWEQGVSEVTVLIIFISSIYTMAFKAFATVLNHYWNPRYIGPFISVFWSHDYDKPNDKSSPLDLFLQAIAHAIKFRKVADAKDRAYALYGVLRSQGVRLSKPDYRQSESTVYYHLYCDLLYWDRASLAFLMDAGITEMPGKPSWVPDWKEAGSRSWLPLNIYTSRPRSGKARKLLDEARSISGDDTIFIRVDGKTLEVLGVIVGPVRTCFGPPRVGSRSAELMLAETATPHDDPTRRDEVFDTENEDSEAEDVFSSLCRFCSSKEQFTSLWVARRRLMAIRRDLADLCHWADLARHDSPCTPAYYSIPKAIFEVLQAKRLTTQFRRKWDGAVLADGSNIEQLFDMVPEPVPDGFQKLYLSISTHLGERTREDGWSYEDVADMVLVDISGDAEVVRFLETSLGELAGRRNLFTTAKGHIGSGPPEMAPGDLVTYIAGVPVPMIIRRARYEDGYIVIGPSYVQGLMDGEEIDEMQMEILKLL